MRSELTPVFPRSILFIAALLCSVGAVSEDSEPQKFATFVRITNDGSELPTHEKLANSAGGWACVRDQKTGLTWEVKSNDSSLHDKENRFTPYKSNPNDKGSWEGHRDTSSGRCDRSSMLGNSCNTEAYVAAVNAEKYCGYGDWRLPTGRELTGISGDVNTSFFPNTADGWHWTAFSRDNKMTYSRVVLLPPGGRSYFYDGTYLVRLVRGHRP